MNYTRSRSGRSAALLVLVAATLAVFYAHWRQEPEPGWSVQQAVAFCANHLGASQSVIIHGYYGGNMAVKYGMPPNSPIGYLDAAKPPIPTPAVGANGKVIPGPAAVLILRPVNKIIDQPAPLDQITILRGKMRCTSPPRVVPSRISS